MIKLLAFLWCGCWHKWAILKNGPIVCGGQHIGNYYELQCERCGDVKSRNLCA